MNRVITFLFIWTIAISAYAQVENLSALSIEQIMQGEKFVGYLPNTIEWSVDSKTVYFDWNPDMDTLSSLYKYTLDDAKTEKVSVAELQNLVSGFTFNKQKDQLLYQKDGDIYLANVTDTAGQAITNTIARESNPIFTNNGNVIFQQKNNLYSWNATTGTLHQLTNFKKGGKASEEKLSKPEQWLEDDQLNYFEIHRSRADKRKAREYRSSLTKSQHPSPIYTGSKSVSNISCSPDGRFVTYRLTQKNVRKRSKVMHHVTESGYAEAKNARAKVGGRQDTYQMGVYDTKRDTYYIVNTNKVAGIRQKPAFLKEYHDKSAAKYQEEYSKPREVLIHGPIFSEEGLAAVVLRSMDNKDRWIMLLDLETGDLKLLDRQQDEAWIGGPGISGWNFSTGNIGWLNAETLWYQSEATGYSHIYTVHVKTGKKKQLTKGKFEIHDAVLSEDKQRFYLSANKENPHEQHFYWMNTKGGKLTKITDKAGKYEVQVSPDETQLAIRYSYSNRPWELYLMPNQAGAKMQQITQSTTEAFEAYDWRDPEIVRFTARDGIVVPARIYKPQNPNGAAVIFVHGAGYLQNVHRWWSSYYREYMFHNILADNGYTVLDIDFRASEGYGRDWRTAIYRHMGGADLNDQLDGAKYLIETHDIDPARLGIYGGSYGGFITMMAQFTSPGTFKSGAALRSVTDWAHYNHPYTSNILNTPVEDSLAYHRSSPIYHAEGLEDNLLILHGMVDSNVQFQDVVRLAQRLIELGKDNWEFAVFPIEGHGFREASSWADEYKRIFKLFQTTLRE